MKTVPYWFLVKGNWPKSAPKFPVRNPRPLYAGLGGNVWPFDSDFDFDKDTKDELQDLHARMDRSRVNVDFGGPFLPSICADVAIAEEYFAAVKNIAVELGCFEWRFHKPNLPILLDTILAL